MVKEVSKALQERLEILERQGLLVSKATLAQQVAQVSLGVQVPLVRLVELELLEQLVWEARMETLEQQVP
jgi:hypothetical protein